MIKVCVRSFRIQNNILELKISKIIIYFKKDIGVVWKFQFLPVRINKNPASYFLSCLWFYKHRTNKNKKLIQAAYRCKKVPKRNFRAVIILLSRKVFFSERKKSTYCYKTNTQIKPPSTPNLNYTILQSTITNSLGSCTPTFKY